jgi:thiamine-monophosphate kinase
MNEFDLIARLCASLPSNPGVIAGAGDDCAVLDSGQPGRALLFKTDAVVEGVHFLPSAAPESIGHKALARCLSDIAAMAGRPLAALVTLALPNNFDPEFIQRIYDGMSGLARRHGVAIVGGETTSNPERLLISIALLGEVARDKCVPRSGAADGDALFVTGELGGSLAGKHLIFEPRLAEARWLAGHFSIHAMIDLSDGLAGDLRHLMECSKVGAELLVRAIPISRAARAASRLRPDPASRVTKGVKTPLLAALTDGEDYELLFAVSPCDAVPLSDAWRAQFPKLRLSCIGKITSAPGLTLRDAHGTRALEAQGYVHFSPDSQLTNS